MKKKENRGFENPASAPRLELTGNTQCIVEGIQAICLYNEDVIKIDLGRYCVSFFGDGLYINSFTYEGAVIEGVIVSMEFEGYA